jgi:solute carrier family 26 (sodium-independent sulfate anion transporter), member 11
MRNAFTLIILSVAAYLYTHNRAVNGKYPIKLLGPVPRGFKRLASPHIDPELVKVLAPQLPLATIILLLEHIAISKCRFSSIVLSAHVLMLHSVRTS